MDGSVKFIAIHNGKSGLISSTDKPKKEVHMQVFKKYSISFPSKIEKFKGSFYNQVACKPFIHCFFSPAGNPLLPVRRFPPPMYLR
jgi:hypothetical protein